MVKDIGTRKAIHIFSIHLNTVVFENKRNLIFQRNQFIVLKYHTQTIGSTRSPNLDSSSAADVICRSMSSQIMGTTLYLLRT